MKCPICEKRFTPEKNQKPAWWAENWYTQGSGLLCPDCHKAALELSCVCKKPLPLGVCPFKSDIALKSSNVSRTLYSQIKYLEGYKST